MRHRPHTRARIFERTIISNLYWIYLSSQKQKSVKNSFRQSFTTPGFIFILNRKTVSKSRFQTIWQSGNFQNQFNFFSSADLSKLFDLNALPPPTPHPRHHHEHQRCHSWSLDWSSLLILLFKGLLRQSGSLVSLAPKLYYGWFTAWQATRPPEARDASVQFPI